MKHADIDTVLGWRGRTVRDAEGEKLGTLGDVFLDSETDLPAWAGVKTGLFGMKESYVPLERIEEDSAGDLRVPFGRDLVNEAPRIDPEVALSADEEAALWDHYGRQYEMTRSEEEVHAEAGPMRPAERVRLKKVLVTEHVTRTVPVRKEVVRLEHDPPQEGRIESVEPVEES